MEVPLPVRGDRRVVQDLIAAALLKRNKLDSAARPKVQQKNAASCPVMASGLVRILRLNGIRSDVRLRHQVVGLKTHEADQTEKIRFHWV